MAYVARHAPSNFRGRGRTHIFLARALVRGPPVPVHLAARFVNLAHGVFHTISKALQALESIRMGTTKVVDHVWP